MPPKFTKSLADRLDSTCPLRIKEAEDHELIKDNTIYIAPGGFHMFVKKNFNGFFSIEISDKPTDTLHRPSVDVMLNSVVECYGKSTLGVIMTGMGKDGLLGIQEIKKQGGFCIAQDEESCVVYGMPKAIVDARLADIVSPLEKIPSIINKALVV
jgi:two-component system chemotaxis response regulator CheB